MPRARISKRILLTKENETFIFASIVDAAEKLSKIRGAKFGTVHAHLKKAISPNAKKNIAYGFKIQYLDNEA